MTDVHQSTDAQKGNPPSRAHHHLPLPLALVANYKTMRYSRRVLPSLGEVKARAGRLVNAVPLVGGHRGPYESERQARLSAPRPRGSAARRRQRGEREEGREGGMEGGGEDRGHLLKIHQYPADHCRNA